MPDSGKLDFDFTGAAKKPPRPKPTVLPPSPQSKSKWDKYDGKPPYDPLCKGTVDELRANLLGLLEEVRQRVAGERKDYNWNLRSRTWPYLQAGTALMRCINIADAIWDKLHDENNSSDDGAAGTAQTSPARR